MSKTIVFFGTDSFSASALRALIGAGYTIAAVVTKPDSKQGRGHQLTAPLVKDIAVEHGLVVWQPLKLSEIVDDIKALGPVTGVLSSYGKIVPQVIIDLFEIGIINVHPSLLPKYRGPSPIETAITNGDSKTGVSIMQLTAAMDAGPVYAQRPYDLNGTETQPGLYETLSNEGSNLLIEVLPQILDGTLRGMPQLDDDATYCHLLKKEDALLDLSKITAVDAERSVRAHLLYPKSKLTAYGQSIIVLRAHVADEPTDSLAQQGVDGKYLVVDSLIGPSGKQMSGEAFVNGYAN